MIAPIPHFEPAARLLDTPPYFLFFTGKGGVGKTSLACATAVALSDQGRSVLLVSTDPASNLDEVLGVSLSRTATPVPGSNGLHALNINPAAAAEAYREKVVGPLRGILPGAALRSVEEQLSGACTLEIAAFDEFVAFLGAHNLPYDHVIFDTAPTGHTLRLMGLSQAWSGFLDQNTSGTSCLGPLAGMDRQRVMYKAAVHALADATRTRMVLVSRPQRSALQEAERTSTELSGLGIRNQVLVLNGLFRATDSDDPLARSLEDRGREALAAHARFLGALPVYACALRADNLIGLERLRHFFKFRPPVPVFPETVQPPAWRDMESLVDELQCGGHGVIMTMGKGGVGKTTLAAALAHALAERGEKVHLSTTDPAAHITDAAGTGPENLTLGRIDPSAETAHYVAEVMAAQGAGLGPESRALLEEDLRSPCTEEIAVFRAFARTVARGRDRFVILDTAPTGHTLLLLDATEAYHRELGRQSRRESTDDVRDLLPHLRDPAFTRILLVTLPEATPVHEAAELQADLERAGMHPYTWIVNQSLSAAGVSDPLLRARAAGEAVYLREVENLSPRPPVLVASQAHEPAGPAGLRVLRTLSPLPCS